jgi:hypothetical protein
MHKKKKENFIAFIKDAEDLDNAHNKESSVME